MTKYELTCHGVIFIRTGEMVFDDAKRLADDHILSCPKEAPSPVGAIEWHMTSRKSRTVWVSAAGGQWLNHHIRLQP